MISVFTRPLTELRRTDAGDFGGKSANLGDMIAASVPVPNGFAVSAAAYRLFVDTTGLEGLIAAAQERAAGGDVESVDAASKAIDEAMRFAPLPEAVRAELAAGYEALGDGDPAVAVRSSAIGEDSDEATFAGQQESFLWVRGVEHVCDAVRDCWVSLYTSRAMAYRATHPAANIEPSMGVTVQLMVDARVSGVLFTCNPVSGDPSMVAINASWGLGLAVVGGDVTPDDFLVSKVTGEVVRQTVSKKEVEYVPDPAGRGTVRLDVPQERQEEPCLGEEELAALVETAQRVERHFGSHQDVEWALARGQSLPEALVLLQARPVTALPQSTKPLSGSALSLIMSTFGVTQEKDD
jgi:pyruvate,water dikinase